MSEIIVRINERRWRVKVIEIKGDSFEGCKRCPSYLMDRACSEAIVIQADGATVTLSDLCNAGIGFQIITEIKEPLVIDPKRPARAEF